MKQIPDAAKKEIYDKIYKNIASGNFGNIENDVRAFLAPYMQNETAENQLDMASDFVIYIRKNVPLTPGAVRIAISGARLAKAMPQFVLDCGAKIYGTGLFLPDARKSGRDILEYLQIKPGLATTVKSEPVTQQRTTTPNAEQAPVAKEAASPKSGIPIAKVSEPVAPAVTVEAPRTGLLATLQAFFKRIANFFRNMFVIKQDPEPVWKAPEKPTAIVVEPEAPKPQPVSPSVSETPKRDLSNQSVNVREASTETLKSTASTVSEPVPAPQNKKFQERLRKLFTPKKAALQESNKSKTPRLDKMRSMLGIKKKSKGGN